MQEKFYFLSCLYHFYFHGEQPWPLEDVCRFSMVAREFLDLKSTHLQVDEIEKHCS